MILGGCAMDMADGFEDAEAQNDVPAEDNPLQQAEMELANHRVDLARQIYAQYLDDDPDDGTAAAGLAITDLLLSAQMDEVTELLNDNLGASGTVDANDVFYAEDGFLYWASRGARWDDDGDQYQGIRSLLSDRLPWESSRLASLVDFVDGLDEPAGEAIRQLVTIANALEGVDHNLAVAIEDPEFTRLYVPGEVFHDTSLTLRLGRSELSAMRAGIALFRSAVYFVAAYEHDWNLERAFGQWRLDPDLDDPRYEDSFDDPIDYTVDYFDDHLFRSINAPDRLSASRTALKEAIEHSRDAIFYGLDERSSTTLQWEAVEQQEALAIDGLLEAIGLAIDAPTVLPQSDPEITVDLSVYFDDGGQVLDEETSWFVRAPQLLDEDPETGMDRWELNDQAIDEFVTGAIFEPTPDDGWRALEVGPDGQIRNFVDLLFSPYRQAIDEVYFGTR